MLLRHIVAFVALLATGAASVSADALHNPREGGPDDELRTYDTSIGGIAGVQNGCALQIHQRWLVSGALQLFCQV